ncbi:MAG: gamma carbonic anhydrase family protein [Bacteroidetes bacterium]|nr:gamma carbonic anhydrase family protein [Bacteroidota bacterium]
MCTLLPYEGKLPQVHNSVYLAHGVRIIGDVRLDEDCSVWFNAVLRGDINSISISKGTNIQDLCVLHVTRNTYPLRVGQYSTIGHNAILHGCTIGDYTLIGMGSIILDGATIGNNVLIAAGTVLPEQCVIPDGVLVAGVPGKIKRELNEEEKAAIVRSAHHYIEIAAQYSNSMKKG